MSVVDLFGPRRATNAVAYAGDGFDAFWSHYPRRVAKVDAHRAWRQLSADDRARATQAIDDHVAYWADAGRDMDRIPHAATWLRGRRFEDELPSARAREAELRRFAERSR